MGGIYIHIPFCRKACHYCDFHFSTQLQGKSDMVKAIRAEMELRVEETPSEIGTVYFGGGTPSILEEEQLNCLIDPFRGQLIPEAEITLEVNPEDISPGNLDAWHRAGINRLSIGIQSFNDSFLSSVNRNHDSALALEKLAMVKKGPIPNFSLDLMFGKPVESTESLQAEMDQLLSFSPLHLSIYCLTVEEKTVLHKHWQKGQFSVLADEKKNTHYAFIIRYLAQHGFQQYEISNFAKPGFESKHNGNYWRNVPFLGFGPGAHGYNGKEMRYWNIRNNAQYIKQIGAQMLPQELEHLSPENQWNELVMVRLRTVSGLKITDLATPTGTPFLQAFDSELKKGLQKKWIHLEQDHLTLTTEGKLLADYIASEFFVE